jgi:plasmid stabilization system protein ParE
LIYAAEARQQIAGLRAHYERLDRPEATVRLQAALAAAERQIEARPASGIPAPRAYPELARPGRAWIKAGRYWVTYTVTTPPVILGVFYETADIPRRV